MKAEVISSYRSSVHDELSLKMRDIHFNLPVWKVVLSGIPGNLFLWLASVQGSVRIVLTEIFY